MPEDLAEALGAKVVQHPEEEILFGILACRRRNDEIGEQRWLARLKNQSLRWKVLQLLGDHQVSRALEALVDFPGLFASPIRLGVLHRYHMLKCSEVKLTRQKHNMS